jgi:hypothetical protein
LVIGVSTGFVFSGVAACSLLVEISTIFINYRCLYRKDQMGQMVPQIIQVLFFILYTIFRMCLFPWATARLVYGAYYIWDLIPLWRKVCAVISVCQYLMMWALNTYWYKLILVGLFKLLGIIKSKPKVNKVKESE